MSLIVATCDCGAKLDDERPHDDEPWACSGCVAQARTDERDWIVRGLKTLADAIGPSRDQSLFFGLLDAANFIERGNRLPAGAMGNPPPPMDWKPKTFDELVDAAGRGEWPAWPV